MPEAPLAKFPPGNAPSRLKVMRPMGTLNEVKTLLAGDMIDLIVADPENGGEGLSALLQMLDTSAELGDLPLVLLTEVQELSSLADLTGHHFNAVLLAKPVAREQLVSAIKSGLRFRTRQRQVQELLREQKASNARLAEANSELEVRRAAAAEESLRKTRFLSAISHDIRTPVQAIVLSCELLRLLNPKEMSQKQIEDLTDGLRRNATSLVQLLDDILDIARYDQAKLEFTEMEFPLGHFVVGTLDSVRPLAEAKGLQLFADISTPLAILRADQVKLARVLQNLLSNAIKFTHEGAVRVHAHARTDHGLTLTVQDTGVGIPPSMREAIFDEFAQLSNPERDRTKGTGLGLAICRRLIDGMGGQIRVDDGHDQVGSTFHITLPANRVIREGQEMIDVKVPTNVPRPQFSGLVLLVEDHDPSRVLMQRLLRQFGLEVDVAINGREAIDRMERTRPDLVLLDFMMPVMNGCETVQVIRSRREWNEVPVVMLTAQVSEQIRPAQMEGVTAYLSKPIELPKLVHLLSRLLPMRESVSRPQ
jgi:signal transduction histidine kinase/ActR/RegA family two-component response regulator